MTITARFNHLNYDIDRVQLPAAFQSHTRISWLWNSHDPLKRRFQAWRPMNIYIYQYIFMTRTRLLMTPSTVLPVLRVIEVSILFSQVNALFFVFRFFSSAYSFKRFTESADFWPLFAQTPEFMISWAMISFSLHSQEGINFLRVMPLMTWNNKHLSPEQIKHFE